MKKKNNKKKKIDYKWVLLVTILAFLISIIFSSISETIMPNTHLISSIIIIILFMLSDVIFAM